MAKKHPPEPNAPAATQGAGGRCIWATNSIMVSNGGGLKGWGGRKRGEGLGKKGGERRRDEIIRKTADCVRTTGEKKKDTCPWLHLHQEALQRPRLEPMIQLIAPQWPGSGPQVWPVTPTRLPMHPTSATQQNSPSASLLHPPTASLQNSPSTSLQNPPFASLRNPPSASLLHPPSAFLQNPPCIRSCKSRVMHARCLWTEIGGPGVY